MGIGLISYSLYLWHWPILAWLRILESDVHLPATTAGAAVTASFVMAWLSYRFVEQPFRTPAHRGGFTRPAIFAMSAAMLALPVAAGAALVATDGFAQRLPARVETIAATAADRNPRRPECLGKSPAQGLCRIGAGGDAGQPADFLVWGDSHADMMAPGIEQVARAAGQRGYFAGSAGCAPVTDVAKVNEWRGCPKLGTDIWAWLENRKDIDLVILASRWTLMVEGTRFGGEAGADAPLRWIGDPARRPAKDGNPALFEAALQASVDRILATGRRVVIIGPVPEAGFSVPLDTARRHWLGLQAKPAITLEQYRDRNRRTEAILTRIAARSDKVRYIPLADLFCDAAGCRTLAADGTPLYVDDDHVSRTTSVTLLRPRFETIWNPAALSGRSDPP